MKNVLSLIAGIPALAALAAASPPRRSLESIVPPCVTDTNFQRLAFWIGDWEIRDSAGQYYANQFVRPVVDGCGVTAEWIGRDGNTGMSVSAYDSHAGEWRQVYISNQWPDPLGVQLRRSDSTYRGRGVRFIALTDPPPSQLTRSRITISPLVNHRALQLFEQSNDGGKTWRVVFRAEHRQP
jgi:hypothetical protein